MAFVTVPNMEVGKKIAGGLGKENTIQDNKSRHLFIVLRKRVQFTNAHSYLYQVRKTEHNFLLINLIASELAIALTLSLDFWGSVTRGENLKNYPILCPISGFAHTFFGK